jgi:hypothetical protein
VIVLLIDFIAWPAPTGPKWNRCCRDLEHRAPRSTEFDAAEHEHSVRFRTHLGARSRGVDHVDPFRRGPSRSRPSKARTTMCRSRLAAVKPSTRPSFPSATSRVLARRQHRRRIAAFGPRGVAAATIVRKPPLGSAFLRSTSSTVSKCPALARCPAIGVPMPANETMRIAA